METEGGIGRGSYIWGRSVHNTCIECLWYNVTHGFSQKWKNFFTNLELTHSLNPTLPTHTHIWLLHHLFLPTINTNAQEWAQAWNSHNLQIYYERTCLPRDIFPFGLLQDGPWGLKHMVQPIDELVNDLQTYGIDWEVANNTLLINHLLCENPHKWEEHNPFATGPETHSHVSCEPPNSPFTPAQIAHLDQRLAAVVDLHSRNMGVHRLVWQEAFRICNKFYQP
ncbi:hypothetical protein DFH07DRAFT_865221 [Mycena maculata]|uniref:Integrase core domain-containing protein n=1 Tax=Mycena maculata TaxID=230809 RepID=A0AAD7NYS7_9AGAR|nr:hypothetical protein DFH07DRAFT_865221 [Mycena maculata]